jgi:hypothetical protein
MGTLVIQHPSAADVPAGPPTEARKASASNGFPLSRRTMRRYVFNKA